MDQFCIIYREVLASKTTSCELNLILECILDVVNFIQTRPLKVRIFKKLWMAMRDKHSPAILQQFMKNFTLSAKGRSFQVQILWLFTIIGIFLQYDCLESASTRQSLAHLDTIGEDCSVLGENYSWGYEKLISVL